MNTIKITSGMLEFTIGNSVSPLPGIRSSDFNPNKDRTRGSKDERLAEIEKKRAAQEHLKKQTDVTK